MTGTILSILLGCGLGLNALVAQAQAPAPAQPAQTQAAPDNAPAKDATPASKDTPPAKDAAPAKPAAKEPAKPAAKEAPKEPAKEAPKPAAGKDAPKEAPKDASKDAPKDAAKAPAKEADKPAAKEGDKAAPAAAPAAAAPAAPAAPAADAAKDTPRGPVVVEVFPPAKGAHQPQFTVGEDATRLDGRQLGLALGGVAKDKARGPMTPVAILVDANMTLADLNGLVSLATQAGMKQIRFFTLDSERTMVTEVVPQTGSAFPRGRLESEVMAAPKEPD